MYSIRKLCILYTKLSDSRFLSSLIDKHMFKFDAINRIFVMLTTHLECIYCRYSSSSFSFLDHHHHYLWYFESKILFKFFTHTHTHSAKLCIECLWPTFDLLSTQATQTNVLLLSFRFFHLIYIPLFLSLSLIRNLSRLTSFVQAFCPFCCCWYFDVYQHIRAHTHTHTHKLWTNVRPPTVHQVGMINTLCSNVSDA